MKVNAFVQKHKIAILIVFASLFVGLAAGYVFGQNAEKDRHSKEDHTHSEAEMTGNAHDHSHGHMHSHGGATGSHGAHAHADPKEAELVKKLKSGGYVLFARHDFTETARTKDDQPVNYDACNTQRNLSEAGRANSREIGNILRAQGIVIAKAYASPYCRTIETSQLMFGSAEKVQNLSGVSVATEEFNFEKAGSLLKEFLNTLQPATGSNIAVTAHWGNFNNAFGMHIGEGEVAVLEKQNDQYKVLGTLRPSVWRDVTHDAVRAAGH